MMAAHMLDEVQLPAGLEHPSNFLKADDWTLDAAKDQRRHDGVKRVIRKSEVLDVGRGQSEVRVQSGSSERDGILVILRRNDASIRRVMIEIWPTARADFQRQTV